MTGMSQKHAVAIFIASFFAGLLATVLLVEPQDAASLPTPFFGLAEEETESINASKQVLVISTDRKTSSAPLLSKAPAETASPENELHSGHSAAGPNRPWPQPQAAPATAMSTPEERVDLPLQIVLSKEDIGSLEELVRRVDQQPVQRNPVFVTTFQKEQQTKLDAKVPAHSTETELSNSRKIPPKQERTEPAAADAKRTERVPVQVAENDENIQRKPAVDQTNQATPGMVSPPISQSVKQMVTEVFDTTDAQRLAALRDEQSEQLKPSERQLANPNTVPVRQPKPLAATAVKTAELNPKSPRPESSRTASQGHVGKATVVESPDSLRALVSRTQIEARPEEAAEQANRQASDLTHTENTAEQISSQKVKTAAARSRATTKGLESAAAALERAEQNTPIKSLLTRTLGQPAPAPAVAPNRQPSPQTMAKPASTTPTANPRPSQSSGRLNLAREKSPAADADDLPYPKHWDNQPAISLTPRHPRPRTVTAPAPPLRTDLIGSSVKPKPPIAVSTRMSSAAEASWVDPDRDNWTKAVTAPPIKPAPPVESPRERIVKRLSQNTGRGSQNDAPAAPPPPPDAANSSKQVTPPPETPVKRLLDRLRPNERLRDRFGQLNDQARVDGATDGIQTTWPPPTGLLRQLKDLAAEASPRPSAYRDVQKWIDQVAAAIDHVRATETLTADTATAALSELANCAPDGMLVAGALADADCSSQVRRVAFAVKRRAATWQAARDLTIESRSQLSGNGPDLVTAELTRLLTAIESFEIEATAPQAALIRQAMTSATATSRPGNEKLLRVIGNQYAAPNVRLSLRDQFLTRLMPEATSRTEALNEMILGRQVRGRRVVEQTTSIQLTPDADEICFDLVVDGQLSTYGITDAGPISMTSRGAGQFTVRKPVKVGRQGLLVGPSKASASNRARLMNISTSFDSVPLMGSMLRALAKNQHADNLPEANREVAQKIVWQSCRKCDQESEEKFAALSALIEEKVWNPLVRLGLQPTPYMQTTADMATLRLRLHADTQLAAHTPRPREPTDTLLGLQVHQSALNNAIDRLGIGGPELALEALFTRVQERMGLEPKLPEDLPEGVTVTFEAVEPIRVEFADGLVNVKVSIDALESGRRDWYDVIGQVNYKPVAIGNRVLLERDGPIRIGGPGHRGRIEFALRTIFGKIFPKERPLVLLPEKITNHPGTQDLVAVQAVSWDGWLALALAEPQPLQTADQADARTLR